eukprot:tig00020684_g12907.t1
MLLRWALGFRRAAYSARSTARSSFLDRPAPVVVRSFAAAVGSGVLAAAKADARSQSARVSIARSPLRFRGLSSSSRPAEAISTGATRASTAVLAERAQKKRERLAAARKAAASSYVQQTSSAEAAPACPPAAPAAKAPPSTLTAERAREQEAQPEPQKQPQPSASGQPSPPRERGGAAMQKLAGRLRLDLAQAEKLLRDVPELAECDLGELAQTANVLAAETLLSSAALREVIPRLARLLRLGPAEVQARLRVMRERTGISRKRLGALLSAYPEMLRHSVENFEERFETLEAVFGVRGEACFAEVSVTAGSPDRVPLVAVASPDSLRGIYAALQRIGLSAEEVHAMGRRCPRLASASVFSIMSSVNHLVDGLGMSRSHVAAVARREPEVLTAGADALRPRLEALEEAGLPRESLGPLLAAAARSQRSLLGAAQGPLLLARIRALSAALGVEGADLAEVLTRNPHALAPGVPALAGALREALAGRLGLEPAEIASIVSRAPELLIWPAGPRVVRELLRYGFAASLVADMARRCPKALLVDVEQALLPKLDFLTKQHGVSLHAIAASPVILTYSLEDRLAPRVEHMGRHLPAWHRLFRLETVFHCDDAKFAARYPAPGAEAPGAPASPTWVAGRLPPAAPTDEDERRRGGSGGGRRSCGSGRRGRRGGGAGRAAAAAWNVAMRARRAERLAAAEARRLEALREHLSELGRNVDPGSPASDPPPNPPPPLAL